MSDTDPKVVILRPETTRAAVQGMLSFSASAGRLLAPRACR